MALGRRTSRRSRAEEQHRLAAAGDVGAPEPNGQAVPAPAGVPTPTPGQLEALAAMAMELAERIESAGRALTADEALDVRQSRLRLDAAARSSRTIASDLALAAAELTRVTTTAVGVCDINWGVCPDHGITLLVRTDDSMRCRVPGCREGSADPIAQRCGEPVKYRVVDAADAAFLACTGHALACRQQLTGAVITLASDSLEHL